LRSTEETPHQNRREKPVDGDAIQKRISYSQQEKLAPKLVPRRVGKEEKAYKKKKKTQKPPNGAP
jgi:hypothetical protein